MASLYALGYDIIIVSKLAGISAKINQIKQLDRCKWSSNFVEIILTDLHGAHKLKQYDFEFFDALKCKMRVLDRYGTDPWFNQPEIVELAGLQNEFGGWGSKQLTKRVLSVNTRSSIPKRSGFTKLEAISYFISSSERK